MASSTTAAAAPPWLSGLEEQGFVIVPKVIAPEAVAAFTLRIEEVLSKVKPGLGGTSGYALRHLTQLVPAVKILARSLEIRALIEPVLGPRAFLVRSLFFDKTPGVNWKVAWHQDLTIAVREKMAAPGFGPWSVKQGVVHVQPPPGVLERMLTVRLHLDDCDEENGPLQVLPGSHRAGRQDAARISASRKTIKPTSLLVRAGGAVLMRPLLLHASSRALQPGHRRVIHLEFAAGSLPAGLQWAPS